MAIFTVPPGRSLKFGLHTQVCRAPSENEWGREMTGDHHGLIVGQVFTVNPLELDQVRVDQTIVGGTVVYHR